MQDLEYWIWISMLDLDATKIEKCIRLYPKQKIWDYEEKKLDEIFTKEEKVKILNAKNKENLYKYSQYINKNKIEIITINDKEYPNKLKNINKMPIVLYTIGNKELLNTKSIAVVGSRNCSEYGKTMSQAFSYLLANNKFTIVSGMALGIDTYAHTGALLANGNTIAVIGTGIDLIYPKENEKLMHKIVEENGLVISEYPIGTKPNAKNFPRRNRIISGLSDGLLVIEAKEKSGALITVDFALEQGKEVYVVPRKYY